MSQITGTEVWKAVLSEKNFVEKIRPIYDMIRPYIEATPMVLSEYLDRPLTLHVLLDTKIESARYCLHNDFAENFSKALKINSLLVIAKTSLRNTIKDLEEILEDIPAFLDDWGITEEEYMTGKNIGLNARNKKLYKEGTLTVSEVLRTQPSIILDND